MILSTQASSAEASQLPTMIVIVGCDPKFDQDKFLKQLHLCPVVMVTVAVTERWHHGARQSGMRHAATAHCASKTELPAPKHLMP